MVRNTPVRAPGALAGTLHTRIDLEPELVPLPLRVIVRGRPLSSRLHLLGTTPHLRLHPRCSPHPPNAALVRIEPAHQDSQSPYQRWSAPDQSPRSATHSSGSPRSASRSAIRSRSSSAPSSSDTGRVNFRATLNPGGTTVPPYRT